MPKLDKTKNVLERGDQIMSKKQLLSSDSAIRERSTALSAVGQSGLRLGGDTVRARPESYSEVLESFNKLHSVMMLLSCVTAWSGLRSWLGGHSHSNTSLSKKRVKD